MTTRSPRLAARLLALFCWISATGVGGVASAQNASILNPVPPPSPTSSTMFKNGTVVAITGTASGSGFQNFLVEWAPGLDPSSGWQTTGVTLSGGGSAPVSSGLLATWDTSSIGGPGYFTIRLTVNAANSPSQALTMLYLEPDLLSQGWPILLDEGPYFSAGVVPAVNSDGTLRLVLDSPQIFGPGFGEFWTISPDGSTQRSLLRARGSAQQPAVANLDGNPGDDAVLADSGNIEVFRQDNTSSTLSTSTLDYQRAQILIEDLVGDGHWETIALGSDFQNQVAYVSAWRANGSLLSAQFPIQIADQNPVNTWGNRVRVLAADLNGNGKKELIVQEGLSSTTFTLRLFASDGSPLTWKVPVLSGVPEAMAVADFDHNEKLETILVYYSGAQAIVDVFQPDGTERSGWPISLPNPNQNSESFLAVGDLNRDGRDEIVFSHETYLYVLNDDGTIFSNAWPLQTTEVGYGCVVIGDVDGDGYPEIVTTLNNVAYTN
ncbi:MAG TPA: VCBS repeat-containing protein, partial [Terriglobales bacterium]|nr:VCBS repeat-containing protein [Terriglobales bacterium]